MSAGGDEQPPTLTAIVGPVAARQLLASAGGLAKLAQMTESQLRHLGYDDLVPSFPVLRNLHGGHIALCPLLTTIFGERLDLDDHKTIAKAVELTGRKALVAAKTDLSGGLTSQGSDTAGEAMRAELEAAIDKARRRGKSGADDDRPLPVPEVRLASAAGGAQTRRGGRKVQQARLLDAPTVLEKAQAYVRMGQAVEEQQQQLYDMREVRAELEQRRRLQAKKAATTTGGGVKRARAEDEYKDLLQIRL
jgi:hypothetical protein